MKYITRQRLYSKTMKHDCIIVSAINACLYLYKTKTVKDLHPIRKTLWKRFNVVKNKGINPTYDMSTNYNILNKALKIKRIPYLVPINLLTDEMIKSVISEFIKEKHPVEVYLNYVNTNHSVLLINDRDDKYRILNNCNVQWINKDYIVYLMRRHTGAKYYNMPSIFYYKKGN